MDRQGQEKLILWKECKNMSAEIYSKDKKSCQKKLEETMHLLCPTTKFTPAKYMTY